MNVRRARLAPKRHGWRSRAALIAAVALLTLVTLGAGTVYARSIHCPSAAKCVGSQHNDSIRGDGTNALSGRGGNDTITSAGASQVRGGPGNDRIRTTAGDNAIWGGPGNDVIRVRGGNNAIWGGPGDDVIYADRSGPSVRGRDVIDCGPGRDTVYYDAGLDTITNCEHRHPRHAWQR